MSEAQTRQNVSLRQEAAEDKKRSDQASGCEIRAAGEFTVL